MTQTLEMFHFNSVKLGQILKQFCKEKDISQTVLAKKTGISRDTIVKIFHGEVQETSFEKIFKMCCVLGVPMVVIEMLMIKEEDIDFADKIVLYDTSSGDILPVTEVDTEQISVPDTVIAAAEAVAATEKPPVHSTRTQTTDEYIAFLQAHIEHLTALLDKAMTKG